MMHFLCMKLFSIYISCSGKRALVTKTATEEMNTTVCDARQESSQDARMIDSDESRGKTSVSKMAVLSAKLKPQLNSEM